MDQAVDLYIRHVALVQYVVVLAIRGPLERYLGPHRYALLVFNTRETYVNYGDLPEDMKAELRRRFRPWLFVTVLGIVATVAAFL